MVIRIMKSIGVILGVAVYLLLVASEGQSLSVQVTSEDEQHAIVEKQMLEDLADLLEVKKQDETEPKKNYPPPRPGQIISPCSYYKYGCCQDGKTKARGPNKEGCGELICVNNAVGYCMKNRNILDCSRGSEDYKRCTYTCGCPKKPASKLQECMKSRTAFGCCWNGQAALTPNKQDCLPCRDLTPHTCAQFRVIAGGCASGSYGIRTFMENYCPETCGVCYLKK